MCSELSLVFVLLFAGFAGIWDVKQKINKKNKSASDQKAIIILCASMIVVSLLYLVKMIVMNFYIQ